MLGFYCGQLSRLHNSPEPLCLYRPTVTARSQEVSVDGAFNWWSQGAYREKSGDISVLLSS